MSFCHLFSHRTLLKFQSIKGERPYFQGDAIVDPITADRTASSTRIHAWKSAANTHIAVADADIQIRGGGVGTVNDELYLHDHKNTYIIAKAMFRNQNYNTDPEIRLMPGLKMVWFKNKGGWVGGGGGLPLDPPRYCPQRLPS